MVLADPLSSVQSAGGLLAIAGGQNVCKQWGKMLQSRVACTPSRCCNRGWPVNHRDVAIEGGLYTIDMCVGSDKQHCLF